MVEYSQSDAYERDTYLESKVFVNFKEAEELLFGKNYIRDIHYFPEDYTNGDVAGYYERPINVECTPWGKAAILSYPLV